MGPNDPATQDVATIVLGAGARERRGRMAAALVAALAAHAVLLLAVRGTEGSHATKPPLQMEARVYELDVAAPAPPPMVPPPPERAVVERHARATEIRDRAATPARTPSVGRAASVVAAEPDPGVPLDLTGDAIVTGQATAYAGGVTAAAGISAAPGRAGPATTVAGDAVVATAIDRASPVSLESEKWSCPWPPEADSEQIDEQTVILRVVVDASGAAEKATVLADPGHGFGPAAVACALRTRFVPARGRGGEAVRSRSPPIRVRFTR